MRVTRVARIASRRERPIPSARRSLEPIHAPHKFTRQLWEYPPGADSRGGLLPIRFSSAKNAAGGCEEDGPLDGAAKTRGLWQ
jgi:hypothetical protein